MSERKSYRSVTLEALPDVLVWLGRCMCSRKDRPESTLWRTATIEFFDVLDRALELQRAEQRAAEQGSRKQEACSQSSAQATEENSGKSTSFVDVESPTALPPALAEGKGDVNEGAEESERPKDGSEDGGVKNEALPPSRSTKRLHWLKFWKELANLYENFLRIACGPSVLERTAKKVSVRQLQEDLEMEERMVTVLSEQVLTNCEGSPREVKQQLVSLLLDLSQGIVSGALPGSAEDCFNRFCLICIQHVGRLCRRPEEAESTGGNAAAIEIASIALPPFFNHSRQMLTSFRDECLQRGTSNVSTERKKEAMTLLVELEQLTLHPSIIHLVPSDDANPLAAPEFQNRGSRQPLNLGSRQLGRESDDHWESRGNSECKEEEEGEREAVELRGVDALRRRFGSRRLHLLVLYDIFVGLISAQEPLLAESLRSIFQRIGEELGLTRAIN